MSKAKTTKADIGIPISGNSAESQATEPPAVEHRLKPPVYPFLVGDGSRRVANQISQIALLANNKVPDSFEACIRTLRLVPVKNVHPNVGAYRAECIDWLLGRKAALK